MRQFNEIMRFTNEVDFKQWFDAEIENWTRKERDRNYYFCRFSRRQDNACPAVMRVTRLLHLGEILVEQAGEHTEHVEKENQLRAPHKKFINQKLGNHLTPGQIQDQMIREMPGSTVPKLQQIQNFVSRQKAKNGDSLDYTDWAEYQQLRNSFHIIAPSQAWPGFYGCNCWSGSHLKPCKHSVMVMCVRGTLNYPPEVTADVLHARKKRGRPKKVAGGSALRRDDQPL